MAYNSIDRSRNDELNSLTRKLENREEELQRIITDTESRYGMCNTSVSAKFKCGGVGGARVLAQASITR